MLGASAAGFAAAGPEQSSGPTVVAPGTIEARAKAPARGQGRNPGAPIAATAVVTDMAAAGGSGTVPSAAWPAAQWFAAVT